MERLPTANTVARDCTHSSILSFDMLNFSNSFLAPLSLMMLRLRSNTFRCSGFFSRANARCLHPSASMQHCESLFTAQIALASSSKMKHKTKVGRNANY